jgi:hypothetical protein
MTRYACLCGESCLKLFGLMSVLQLFCVALVGVVGFEVKVAICLI